MLEFYKDYYTKLLTQIYQSKSPNNIHKIPNLLHKYGKYPQKLHTIYQKLCNEYGINNIKSFKSIQSAILRKKGIIIKAKIWINQTFMNQTINVSMSHNEMTVKHILTRLKNTKYYKSMENPIIIVKCVSCNICHNTDLLFDYNNYDSGRYYENQYNKNIHLTEWFISSLKYEFGIKSPYRCVTELERACNIYRPIFHVYTNNSGLTTYHKYDDMINIQVSFKYALYLSLSSVKMEICNAIYDTYQWSINSENLVITINNNVLTNNNKSVWDNIATYQTVLPDDVVKFEVYVRDDSIVSMSNDPYIFHTRIEYTKQFDLFDIMKVVDRYCIDHLFFDPDINELIVQYCANLSVGKVLDSGYIVARKDVSMYSIKKKVIVHMMKHHSTHEIWSVYEDSKTIVKTYSNTTNMEMIQYDNKPFQLHRHCYNKCFKIKDRIRINPNEPFGEIAFIGETKYVSESIGINYHRKISHGNCGTVKGVRYFNDGCGYFTDMTRMESAIIYDNNGKQTQWSPANVQNISIIFGRKSIILDSDKTHILVNQLRINGLGFCKQIKHEIIVRKSMKVKGLIKRICKKSKINPESIIIDKSNNMISYIDKPNIKDFMYLQMESHRITKIEKEMTVNVWLKSDTPCCMITIYEDIFDDIRDATNKQNTFELRCYFKPNEFITIAVKTSFTIKNIKQILTNNNPNTGVIQSLKTLDGIRMDDDNLTLNDYGINTKTSIKVFSRVQGGR